MADAFLTLEAVVALTTCSKSELYRRISAGEFPRAVRLSPRRKAWSQREINQWMERVLATAPREGDPL